MNNIQHLNYKCLSLDISHVNIRSLIANLGEFKNWVNNDHCDIVAVTETWLQAGSMIDIVNIDGYKFIRQDRLTRGGGVGMYIKNNLNFSIIFKISDEVLECIWVKIVIDKIIYAFGIVYRPPNANITIFLERIEEIFLNIYAAYDQIICTGDFNINMLNTDSYTTYRFTTILESLNLCQIIKDPTRVTSSSISLIDLIITNLDNNLCTAIVENNQLSDHFAIKCKVKINSHIQESFKTIKFRNLKNINFNQFQDDLERMPWPLIYESDDVNIKIDLLNKYILDLFELHAPLQSRKSKKTKPYMPWITENIKLMQKLRDRALGRYRKTRLIQHWDYYKQLRNVTNAAIKAEKRAYLNYTFSNTNIKEKWRVLQKLNVAKKTSKLIPEHLQQVDDINNFIIN